MSGRNALATGTMLRQYRIESILGQGGFGITYLAFDTELKRNVAVKECFPREYVSRDGTTVVPTAAGDKTDFDWALSKFVDEATTLAKFRHPGIVQVLQILKGENNSAYMVLEYVDGQSLDRWLKSAGGALNEDKLKRVVRPMLDALEVVHTNNIVHRDIAPDNIYIRDNGEAVLLDFGAARQTLTQRSRTMNLIVKDGYSAPEQYYVEGRQGPWTDVYAFGAVLYRAMTGKRPVDAMARLDAINNGEPDPIEPLSGLVPQGYSDSFIKAVEAALAPQVKARPASLREWRPMLLGQDAKAAKAKPVSGAPESAPTNRVQAPKAGRRNVYGLVAAGLLAVAGAGGFLAWQMASAGQKEAEAWANAQSVDTAQAYRDFLGQFGQSERKNEAEQALSLFSKPWSTVSGSAQLERANAVAARSGLIVTAGVMATQGAMGSQAVLKAFSEAGRERWQREFGEAGNEQFNDLAILDDTSIVAAGSISGASNADQRGLLVKFDKTGKVLWSREAGKDRKGAIMALVEKPGGGFLAAGLSRNGPNGGTDGWLLTLDEEGQVTEERFFGDTKDDSFHGISIKPNGEVALVGQSDDLFWLVTLSPTGTIVLNRASGGRMIDRLNAVTVLPTGNIVAVGDTESFGTNSIDGMILRVESDGKIPPKAVADERDDIFKDVLVTADGGIVVVGHTSSRGKGEFDGWIRKYDSDLNRLLWERVIGSPVWDVFEAATLLEDGSIVAVGSTNDTAAGGTDIWVVRVGADGQYSSQ